MDKSFSAISFSLALLAFSNSSFSMSVDFEYPSLDVDGVSPIVEFVGLEWLRWDITNGLSINEATDLYGAQGWRVASNAEIANLVNTRIATSSNTMPIGMTDNESDSLYSYEDATHSGFSTFIDLGVTTEFEVTDEDSFSYGRDFLHSTALYGSDADGDNLYNLIDFSITNVAPSVFQPFAVSWSELSVSSDSYDRNEPVFTDVYYERDTFYSYSAGVALVRDISVTPVPIPSSLVLFSSALMMLGIWNRKSKQS